jgi:tetratricopeptide (TPR) repeat protein
MKKVLILLSFVVLAACNPAARLTTVQSEADVAFNQADYNKAYSLYSEYIKLAESSNIKVSKELLAKKAQACAHIDKTDEAVAIYDQLLKDEANIDFIAEYAQLLQLEGRIDQELGLWKSQSSRITSPELLKLKAERLVFLNAANENNEAVVTAYESKGETTLSKEAQLTYIKALEATNKGGSAIKACNELLGDQPDYEAALEWKAKYFYNKAEDRYKYEMDKYNKDKNATTYAYLRRDLKKVSADFRIARDTFIQLRKIDPTNQSYIKYLKNTYLRLEQKDEAAQMDKLLK